MTDPYIDYIITIITMGYRLLYSIMDKYQKFSYSSCTPRPSRDLYLKTTSKYYYSFIPFALNNYVTWFTQSQSLLLSLQLLCHLLLLPVFVF